VGDGTSGEKVCGQFVDKLVRRLETVDEPLDVGPKLAKVSSMSAETRPRLPRFAQAAEIRAYYPAARIRLIRAREQMGLSRPKFARLIGLSRYFVFTVEIGTRNPSFAFMQRWAEALDKPLDIFLSDPGPPVSPAKAA
jgi:DNA-binding XRE family transcriptional regulator